MSYNFGIHWGIVNLQVSGCDFRVDNPTLSIELDQASNISLMPVPLIRRPEGAHMELILWIWLVFIDAENEHL